MTGGTLIVKMGNTYAMTKVAHDGYDLAERLDEIKTFAKGSEPRKVCDDYLKMRNDDDFSPFFSPDLFVFVRSYDEPVTMDEALDRMEDELDGIVSALEMQSDYDDCHPLLQLVCSYCDYVLEIDLDKHEFTLNGDVA